MYFREAMMETLDEIMTGKEIDNIVLVVKKYKYKKLGFFEKRRELKRLKKFIEEYKFVKESGTLPHWIPTLLLMPEEVMRDLLTIMVGKYRCELCDNAKTDKEDEGKNV